MLKYGRMSSHSKIFKVSLAIYLYLPDCFEKSLSNTQLVRIEMNWQLRKNCFTQKIKDKHSQTDTARSIGLH